jgi:hypothetical protein
MTQETIIQLLDKYWNCETSQEEEQSLTAFFSGDEIPEEWQKYKTLFAWKKKQAQITGSKKLKSGPPKTQLVRFYPFIKVAASVLIFITIGTGVYTHYEQEKFMDTVFSETYSDPEEALRTTENVLEKVSAVLQLAQDKKVDTAVIDSLEVKTKTDTIE